MACSDACRERKLQPRSPRRFRKKTRVFCASRAIFTKYMIHRFIKHGKRFDEKIHKKICVKISDLRDAGNYAINPAILQLRNCTIDCFALFRRGYRRFSFIARMDRFGKRSATYLSFRCGWAEWGCPEMIARSKWEAFVSRADDIRPYTCTRNSKINSCQKVPH